jgi:hypothetical protein
MKEIIYKNKPATIMAEVTRRNPTFDRNRQIMEPGKIFCQLEVDGREEFAWIEYELLYDVAGNPR